MKTAFKIIIYFLLLENGFSQKKDLNYFFDIYEVTNIKKFDFRNGFSEKKIIFLNSQDSTYSLQLRTNIDGTFAELFDFKKEELTVFKINKVNFEKNDLSNLYNPKLKDFYFHKHNKFHNRKKVDVLEMERDTISNQTIVHLTTYENKKMKNIIHEDYYIFNKMDLDYIKLNQEVKNLISIHQVKLKKNEILTKLLCLKKGKINTDIEYLEKAKINYNLIFNRN